MNTQGFGMGNVDQFQASAPIVVDTPPENQGGGKSTGGMITGILSPILGMAAQIPGKQQPFIQAAKNINDTTRQVIQNVDAAKAQADANRRSPDIDVSGNKMQLPFGKEEKEEKELVDPNLQKNPYLEMLMNGQNVFAAMPPSPQLPNQYPFQQGNMAPQQQGYPMPNQYPFKY